MTIKEYTVTGTHGVTPFVHKTEARTIEEAQEVVRQRLRARNDRLPIRFGSIAEVGTPIRETNKFSQG
jgi:hypothetical protein